MPSRRKKTSDFDRWFEQRFRESYKEKALSEWWPTPFDLKLAFNAGRRSKSP